MKLYFPAFSLLLASSVFLSCSNERGKTAGFSISGYTADSTDNGKYAYLSKYGTLIDSTIINNNSFSFQGSIDSTEFAKIRIDNNNLYFILENGEILIDKSLPDSPSGTYLNDVFANITLNRNIITQDFYQKSNNIMSLPDISEDYRDDLLQQNYTVFRNRLDSFTLTVMDENKENAIATYIMWCESMMHDKPSYLDSLYQNCISDNLKNNPLIENIVDQNTKLLRTDIGNAYTDFEVTGLDNENSTLSAVKDKNKYTVLFFWASWCRICKIEIENVVKAYNELDENNVQFINIMTWDKKNDVVKMLEKNPSVKWTTLLDYENQAVSKYGILGIPHVIIISPQGNIVSRWISTDRIVKEIQYAIQKV